MSTRLLCPECHGDRFIVDDDNEEFNCDCCDARGWIVGEPDAEVTALRARVRELEGEVQRLCLSLTHEGPDLTKRVLDRAIAARGKPLLPAPAPGRDTTTSRDLAAGGNDGE